MNRIVLIIIPAMMVIFTGCSQIQIPFFGKQAEQADNAGGSAQEAKALEENEFIDKGRIIEQASLQNGKNIAIVPFKAGVHAEATDELNSTALTIIKGVTDAFADDQTGKHAHFNVLTAENADEADLIVRGHITRMSEPSKFKRWFTLNRKKALGIEGKIIDANTGDAVLVFEEMEQAGHNDEDYKELGLRIGKNLGRYILSGVE